MPITHQHRSRFTILFLAIFYVLAFYKLLNGLWLFQVTPFYFNNRFDGTTWLFMLTGFHEWLASNKVGWILMDILFYGMPLCWWMIQKRKETVGKIIVLLWLLVNWLYVQSYVLYPTNSIESYTAWLLMPVLFLPGSLKSFYYLLHAGRYFFLFFFASAGIWKIRQMGLFNIDQMSGVLLMQHKEYLVSAPDAWFSQIIYFIIHRPALGYILYMIATILELVFIIGFFTRKFDSWLIVAFLLFLLADLLLMRIPYFETFPWILTLYFSRYKEPA